MRVKLFLILIIIPFISFAQKDTSELNSQLFAAVLSENLDSVSFLLDQGANVNSVNIYGITPLLYAVDLGNYQLVKLLIDRGADVNYLPPYDPPAISAAVIHNQDSILKLLLKEKANPDLVDKFGYTPLAYAIYFGNYYAADLLLYYGANPDKRFNNWAPLELACYYDDTLLVNMLIYYGVNINTHDEAGFTPLHICAQQNSVLSSDILLSHGADLNYTNVDNATPVSLAVYERSNDVLTRFMDYKPDLSIKVKGKYYPATVAVLVQNYKALRMLSNDSTNRNQLVFNGLVGITTSMNFGDLFVGLDVGFKELSSNIDFLVSMQSRLLPKRVWFEQSDFSYIQLWEQRWFFNSSIVKNFYLGAIKKSNFYWRLGGIMAYSFAKYRGSTLSYENIWFSPLSGFSMDIGNFIFAADFDYFNLQGLNNSRLFFNFTMQLRISPYKLDLTQKRFYLRNEPIF